jgi:hypothetical protein
MSRKRKDRTPRPEAEDWHLEKQLIVVRSAAIKKPNENELMRLELTKRAGGLVKERWRWEGKGGLPFFDGYLMPEEQLAKVERRSVVWRD